MYREALAMQKKLLGNEHPNVAASLKGWPAASPRGSLAEAEALSASTSPCRKDPSDNWRAFDAVSF